MNVMAISVPSNMVVMQPHVVQQRELDLAHGSFLELQDYQRMIMEDLYQCHFQPRSHHATIALANTNLDIDHRVLQ